MDKCNCPKNPLEKQSINVICYISGKTKDMDKFDRPYCSTHRDPQWIHLVNGIDRCGPDGLWWEPKEPTWWQKFIQKLREFPSSW